MNKIFLYQRQIIEMNKIIMLASILFCSCKGANITQFKVIDPGWQVFNYPRTTWAPGHVFRIPENGDLQEVTTLRSYKPFETGYASIPVEYEKRSLKVSSFLRFLFLNPGDSTIKANGERIAEISMEIGQAYSESLDEITIDSLVKASGINWKENNKYYIIQSTLSTKKIRYKAITKGCFDVNSVLNFKKVNSNSSISKDRIDSSYLNQDFETNYRVYYRAIEINPMGSASSNNKKYTYRNVDFAVIQD
jgi:hypothetical protein